MLIELLRFDRYEGKTAKNWAEEAAMYKKWWLNRTELNDALREIEDLETEVEKLEAELRAIRSEFMTFQRNAIAVQSADNEAT